MCDPSRVASPGTHQCHIGPVSRGSSHGAIRRETMELSLLSSSEVTERGEQGRRPLPELQHIDSPAQSSIHQGYEKTHLGAGEMSQ